MALKTLICAAAVLTLVGASVFAQSPGYAYVPFGPLGKGGSTYEKSPEEKGTAPSSLEKKTPAVLDDQERQATVKSPTKIAGCDAGLMFFGGQYKCKSLVPEKDGGTLPDDMENDEAQKKPSGAMDAAGKDESPNPAK